MDKKKNKKQNFDIFNYYWEDINCLFCKYRNKCNQSACRFEEIKQEAIRNGRIRREPGWFSCFL
jgi:hypothetical protein